MNVIVKLKVPETFTTKDKALAKKVHKHLITEANNYFKSINISDKFSNTAIAKPLTDQIQFVINHYNRGLITRQDYNRFTKQIQKAMNQVKVNDGKKRSR